MLIKNDTVAPIQATTMVVMMVVDGIAMMLKRVPPMVPTVVDVELCMYIRNYF